MMSIKAYACPHALLSCCEEGSSGLGCPTPSDNDGEDNGGGEVRVGSRSRGAESEVDSANPNRAPTVPPLLAHAPPLPTGDLVRVGAGASCSRGRHLCQL